MKKMNMRKLLENKGEMLKLTTLGFTLVELLAVIVILAIVLIIAVPGVLSIINSTKENAYKSQLKMIKEAARTYITTESDKVSWNDKTTVVTLDILKSGGYLEKEIIDPRNKKEIVCANVLVTKTKSNRITYEVNDTCNNSHSITPRVGSGMIPIVYNGTNWVKADTSNQKFSWFNYGNQQWANIATVEEDVRSSLVSAEVGTVVPMDKINGMYTWIPRFKYKLFNVDGTVSPTGNKNLAGDMMMDVKFETKITTKSIGTKNGEWLTHPAFTFGGEELDGFWVGKFEVGYKDATTSVGAQQNVLDSSKVITKPNVYSWREIQTSTLFHNAQAMVGTGIFGITASEDPHLVKNMEWGAMTYLTNSRYGKTGNSLYSGVEREVRINNNASYITGCGAEIQNAEKVDSCNEYNSVIGIQASTTGNITGVYDTSGGAWDYVAGVMKAANGTDLVVSSSGFPQDELNQLGEDLKYFDVYENNVEVRNVKWGHLGDATIEMGPFTTGYGSWNNDFSRAVEGINSWLVRGGSHLDEISALGINGFFGTSGYNGYHIGGRFVLR